MAMLRHRAVALGTAEADGRNHVPARLLYSSRRRDKVVYRDELARLVEDDSAREVAFTLTREQPRGGAGFRRRMDRMMLAEVAWPPAERPHVASAVRHAGGSRRGGTGRAGARTSTGEDRTVGPTGRIGVTRRRSPGAEQQGGGNGW